MIVLSWMRAGGRQAVLPAVKKRAVRYGKEHTQATRRRIIETAGRRLKRGGIDGSGVAALMADAGLTNGAFYAHFTSKEDLVAATVADHLREQRASFSERAPGRAGAEQYMREYLSVQHRATPATAAPPPPCSTRSGAARTPPSRHTPTAYWPPSTTSPPAWRPTTRPRHARTHSASSP
jgi:AcrR family transcriptional regulator